MVVDPSMLEAVVRSHLNLSAPRTMVVLEPLKVNIVNLVKNVFYEISVPDFPEFPERGSHSIAFGPTIYIEKSDFKETIEKGYRRLAPGQAVGLKYADYVLKLLKIHKGCDGMVSEIDVEWLQVWNARRTVPFWFAIASSWRWKREMKTKTASLEAPCLPLQFLYRCQVCMW